MNLMASGPDVNPLVVQIGGEVCGRLFVASVEIGQPESSNLSFSFPLFPSTFTFVCFHHFRWLMGAHGKTLVRVAVLDRAGNAKIWCDSRGDFEGFRCDWWLFRSFWGVLSTMAPRRRPREGVAEQETRQEDGDTPPPQQTQPLPQDAHSGIVPPPPPPPPQAAQGLDLTRFLEGIAQFVALHRDAPVPQGGIGKVLREFLQFQPPQFLGRPDPDIAQAWLDAVERTFRSMDCVPEERVLLASYQLQA
ncbi:hypothetical protein Taro_015566 [Colocasia esculenta]|uniref:Uncharacterized protein n=1 Tax=Colocasia esculenta TaxID=4460 RepID=A0A843UQ97_COLES|nr:hypothetical protein [Colocasia esculenta]